LIFGLLLLLLGCNPDRNEIPEGLMENQVINVGNVERNYHLFLPDNPSNAPLVILLHGNGSSHDELIGLTNAKAPYEVWLDIAEVENIIVAVPNGTLGSSNKRGWNDCRNDASTNPNVDDVLFISSLIDEVVNDYGADADRVYVQGTSNGGHLSIRLAQEIPGRLAAFAAVVASNSVNSQCSANNTAISAMFINGTADSVLPYEGGEMASNRGEVFSTENTIDYWVDINGTDTSPIVSNIENINTNDDCSIQKYEYKNGTNNTEVVLLKVIDGGHTEPSIAQRYSNVYLALVGNQNSDIEMAEEVWGFFKDK